MIFKFDFGEFFFTPLLEFKEYTIYPYHVVSFIVIMGLARLVSFVFKLILNRYAEKRGLNKGTQTSIHTIAKYFIYVLAFALFLDNIGIQLTVFLAGSTALFVGIGLGLQKTFNDFISGIIILFEGSVKVGDILRVDGEIGEVKEIRLRASMIESRDGKLLIVPNSKFVNESITNYTHLSDSVYFEINVTVPNSSDPELVKKALQEAVIMVKDINTEPAPNIIFSNYGERGLEFRVVFRSKKLMSSSSVESKLRFAIYKKLEENNITLATK